MLSGLRDEAAAIAFFMKAIGNNGWPDKVDIDKRGSNTAGQFNMNCLLVMCGWCWLITFRRAKVLNKIIEQDHRFIKKLTRPIQTFKSLNSAAATVAGIDVAHMIQKGQFDQGEKIGFKQFAALAEQVCLATEPFQVSRSFATLPRQALFSCHFGIDPVNFPAVCSIIPDEFTAQP